MERIRRDTGHMKRQMTELDRKRVQTVRLTMTIIICNFFLWAPFCVVNVLQAFAPRLLSKYHEVQRSAGRVLIFISMSKLILKPPPDFF